VPLLLFPAWPIRALFAAKLRKHSSFLGTCPKSAATQQLVRTLCR
jgi:hypothetical protein